MSFDIKLRLGQWLGAFQVQNPREREDRLRNSLEMMQVGDCHCSHCIRNYAGQYYTSKVSISTVSKDLSDKLRETQYIYKYI